MHVGIAAPISTIDAINKYIKGFRGISESILVTVLRKNSEVVLSMIVAMMNAPHLRFIWSSVFVVHSEIFDHYCTHVPKYPLAYATDVKGLKNVSTIIDDTHHRNMNKAIVNRCMLSPIRFQCSSRTKVPHNMSEIVPDATANAYVSVHGYSFSAQLMEDCVITTNENTASSVTWSVV